MSYNENYRLRRSAKKHATKIYPEAELEEIRKLIENYFAIEFPEVLLNTSEAYFVPLANSINESHFNKKDVIKPKYLCELYNGTSNSKKKSIKKMTNIKDFLLNWFGIQKKETDGESANSIIKDWLAKTNTTTPQWTDYIALPLRNGMLKRITFDVFSKTEYYRLGFKFLKVDGKAFGDGSIQSQDNNFVIHIGKNFVIKELFITTYRNGILEKPDKYFDIIPKKNSYQCELNIDPEGFLHFFINGKEVYKNLVNKEIRSRVYMLAWGDVNKYEIKVKNIQIEIERA